MNAIVAANTATDSNGRTWSWAAPSLQPGKYTVTVDGKALVGGTWSFVV